MADVLEDNVSVRENDLRWDAHNRTHDRIDNAVDVATASANRALSTALVDHHREHEVHAKAHDREHASTKEALDKADAALEVRLEGMNEFRAQLEKQSSTFLTREIFETYVKEQTSKLEAALASFSSKYDVLIQAKGEKHDTDFKILRESITEEREHRKASEASISTWKWIATFLGASGLGGVILLFSTRAT